MDRPPGSRAGRCRQGRPIRTPDRRLRVFVSSTLGELEAERRAVRAAIETLRLTPVMFELGARPFAPRDLYRAYLQQSDVFVGIYARSYGFVAPGMGVSGLEDEYRLAGDLPKLIYVKRDAGEVDPRLAALLSDIAGGGLSYRAFATPGELGDLLADDLALLLTEGFEASAERAGEAAPRAGPAVPTPANRFVGRRDELAGLLERLRDPANRVVTVTGPGGTGKSRLALEAAARLTGECDRVYLAALETVVGADEVMHAVLSAMGLGDTSLETLDAIALEVGDRRTLLVIDNFEHVLAAGAGIAALVERVPRLQCLVTSRAPLHIRPEQEFRLGPLKVPAEGAPAEEVRASPAVELFLERAAAAGADRAGSDLDAVAELARRLDGLPLALELVAGHTRFLPPRLILERVDQALEVPAAFGDLPDRHRTLRATMAWSFDLLSPEARELAACLAVFEGGAALEAVEAVFPRPTVLEALGSLVAANLVGVDTASGGPRFGMLGLIRRYAGALPEASAGESEARDRHGRHYLGLVEEAAGGLRGPEQMAWLDRLALEELNVHAALRHCLTSGEADRAARAVWHLFPYWSYAGACTDGAELAAAAVAAAASETARERARVVLGLMCYWLGQFQAAAEHNVVARARLTALGDAAGSAYTAMADVVFRLIGGDRSGAEEGIRAAMRAAEEVGDAYGRAWILVGFLWTANWLGTGVEDEAMFTDAIDVARVAGAPTEITAAVTNLALVRMRQGRWGEARDLFTEALGLVQGSGASGSVTMALLAVAEYAASVATPAVCVTLLSAVDEARRWTGTSATGRRLRAIPLVSFVTARIAGLLSDLRSRCGDAVYEEAWAAGRAMSLPEAVGLALRALDRPG